MSVQERMIGQRDQLPLTKGDHVVLRYVKPVEGILCRDTTGDALEVAESLELLAGLELKEDDRVLDVGAGIGSFSVPVAAAQILVLAVEPDQSRNMCCEVNMRGLKRGALRRLAIGTSSKPQNARLKWLVDGQETTQHLQTVPLETLFNIFNPTVIKLSMHRVPVIRALPISVRMICLKFKGTEAGAIQNLARLSSDLEGWHKEQVGAFTVWTK